MCSPYSLRLTSYFLFGDRFNCTQVWVDANAWTTRAILRRGQTTKVSRGVTLTKRLVERKTRQTQVSAETFVVFTARYNAVCLAWIVSANASSVAKVSAFGKPLHSTVSRSSTLRLGISSAICSTALVPQP